MKWEGNRQSDHVEDRRGSDMGDSGPRLGRTGGRGIGLGSIVIALVASWLFGINPLTVLGLLGGAQEPTAHTRQAPAQRPPADDRMASFVSTVLADTEDVWKVQFSRGGASYTEPTLVLFRGATPTACGAGQAAMGPFYCPADRKVYIDLGFFETLKTELGAPGEFAQAYVIAHEVGHHVQNLLGVSERVDRMRGQVSTREFNAMSVRLELQADCLAGLWAKQSHDARHTLENGDIESAMNAAAKIGDDALQQAAQGRVVPDSFTHGSSAQRMRWFNRGLENGTVAACDTFKVKNL